MDNKCHNIIPTFWAYEKGRANKEEPANIIVTYLYKMMRIALVDFRPGM